MLVTIRDDTWNVLNMQHIIPNWKRWDYSDIPPPTHPILSYVVHVKSILIWLKEFKFGENKLANFG